MISRISFRRLRTVSWTSCSVLRPGLKLLMSTSRDESCVAAAVAAAASTSQRAMEMEAAAAITEPMAGKATHTRDSPKVDPTKGSTSTTATVVAAHRPERADVNGRIAPARAPWLAYVSLPKQRQ